MCKYALPVAAAHRLAVSINTDFCNLPHLQLLPCAERLKDYTNGGCGLAIPSLSVALATHMAVFMRVKADEETLLFKHEGNVLFRLNMLLR